MLQSTVMLATFHYGVGRRQVVCKIIDATRSRLVVNWSFFDQLAGPES